MTYVFDIEDPIVYVCGAGWFNSRYDVQQIERIVPLRVSDRHVDDFRQGLLANVTTVHVNQIWSTTWNTFPTGRAMGHPPKFGTTNTSSFSTSAKLRHNWRWPCISVVPEGTHEASRGSLKGAVSAQKALQGSETETRELLGGTEENSVFPMRGQ